MNEGLFSAYAALPEWKTLLEQLPAQSCLALAGMAEGERPFFAAALARRTGRPVLLLSPTELTAQKHAQDISRLTGGGAAALPVRDVQFSRAAASQESTWQRLGALDEAAAGRLSVLCVSAESALDRCCPVSTSAAWAAAAAGSRAAHFPKMEDLSHPHCSASAPPPTSGTTPAPRCWPATR
ncbi:MAG: hypothetical protein GX418_15280, partial [Clostridiales bacterium]|nr:hypothetical protein [Clostridiales bacterium]